MWLVLSYSLNKCQWRVVLIEISKHSGRYYGGGQPSGHRILPTSAASSSTSSVSNKMQSDNYRWDFAHGGRGGHHMAGHPSAQPSVMKSTPTPPSVATWHHHHQAQLLHQQQQKPQVFSSRQQHDYHHHHQFYKMSSPSTDAVIMHRTPQQRHHWCGDYISYFYSANNFFNNWE